jgi:hypothetical protein
MKKYLLILFCFFGGLSFLSAQSPIIKDADGATITNTSINYTFTQTHTVTKVDFFLTNSGENEIVVSMRKVEVDVLEGTDNDFCFAGRCYAPDVFDAPDKMTLAAGSTSNQSECYAQFYPGGVIGSSTLKYEFFSDDESFETVYVEVTFTATAPTSIPSLPFADVVFSDPYPNPARGHTTIDYQLTPEVKSARIILRSLTGQVVQTFPLNTNANSIRIDTSSLNSGMYFYSIELNNQVFLSKRLIVGR